MGLGTRELNGILVFLLFLHTYSISISPSHSPVVTRRYYHFSEMNDASSESLHITYCHLPPCSFSFVPTRSLGAVAVYSSVTHRIPLLL